MAQSIATDPQEEIHKKVASYIETKRYVDEPELLPWYKKELGELKPRTRELLETYSKIAPNEVEPHIHRIVSIIFPLMTHSLIMLSETTRSGSSPTHALGTGASFA